MGENAGGFIYRLFTNAIRRDAADGHKLSGKCLTPHSINKFSAVNFNFY